MICLSIQFGYRLFRYIAVLNPNSISTVGLGCSDFARHYSRNRFYFLFLRVLRCFSSPGSPCMTMCSSCSNTTLLVLSSLIRISTDLWMFAPPRSFSQLATSFFGAIYQGILREPFVAWSSLFLLVSSSDWKFYAFTRLIAFTSLSKSVQNRTLWNFVLTN